MPNYRADQLVNLLRSMDARKNEVDDPVLMDENTIVERFYPIREKLTLSDAVEVATYTPANFVWGNGSTIDANWDWNGGGKWNA